MKRPSFQFYPADWRKDAALQSCSVAAQGLWINMMCIAHECEPYGHLMVNGKAMNAPQIGRLVGLSAKDAEKALAELEDAGVFARTEEGAIFSRRMARDESTRNARANGGHAGAEHGAKGAEHGRKGGRPRKETGDKKPPLVGDSTPPKEPPPSSSSSSSSSSSLNRLEANASVPSGAADHPDDLLGDASETQGQGTAANTPAGLPCPVQRIVDAYHQLMPDNPRVRLLDDARRKSIAARWKQARTLDVAPFGYETTEQGLSAWREFFTVCAESDFLTGRVQGRDNRPPFLADIDFLMSPAGFKKCLENKFHRESV